VAKNGTIFWIQIQSNIQYNVIFGTINFRSMPWVIRHRHIKIRSSISTCPFTNESWYRFLSCLEKVPDFLTHFRQNLWSRFTYAIEYRHILHFSFALIIVCLYHSILLWFYIDYYSIQWWLLTHLSFRRFFCNYTVVLLQWSTYVTSEQCVSTDTATIRFTLFISFTWFAALVSYTLH
jgi:hypothetical protein